MAAGYSGQGRDDGGEAGASVSDASGLKKISLPIIPARVRCAYNLPASAAGVLRETFAGRREPALPVQTVTCGAAGRGESHGCETSDRSASYQASPWQPCRVRFSRASG